jgi:curved DNA-binding protein CbpA
MKRVDYYEFLQISPNAQQDTIHRVYRYLAARFHPDNPHTGDTEMFALLAAAYEVLSDPVRRAEYDTACAREAPSCPPMSCSVDFMDSLEGETNRRLAVLAVLYFRRRANPNSPEVSLYEIETRMGFPRDYLDFTTWYLQKKGYISRADNSDFTLTAQGVDFVESQRVNIPVLNKLLTDGAEPAESAATANSSSQHGPVHGPVVVMPGVRFVEERRVGSGDRRLNSRDRRAVERRSRGQLGAGQRAS